MSKGKNRRQKEQKQNNNNKKLHDYETYKIILRGSCLLLHRRICLLCY